jgi:hypothetical protein
MHFSSYISLHVSRASPCSFIIVGLAVPLQDNLHCPRPQDGIMMSANYSPTCGAEANHYHRPRPQSGGTTSTLSASRSSAHGGTIARHRPKSGSRYNVRTCVSVSQRFFFIIWRVDIAAGRHTNHFATSLPIRMLLFFLFLLLPSPLILPFSVSFLIYRFLHSSPFP